ncbi:MmcB family DNA repair protein [Laceyella putida]|uniref:MmcB family DNA repair protein n=1 Tax=Laceyella putida TaxID=110101 RepID=A0ABW2RR10_9BACL
MITGKDERSLWALERLAEGWKPGKLKDHGFTESQSKKLSQFYNCLIQLERFGQPEHVDKWKELGLKGLVLIKMFKDKDWAGIGEILMAVDPEMKRDELAKYPDLLEEKRKRLRSVGSQVQVTVNQLEKEKEKLQEALEMARAEQEKLRETIPILKELQDDRAFEFFMDHLGIKKGKLCLAKRLDYRWQKNLKKKGIVSFNKEWNDYSSDEDDYVHWVNDVGALVEEYRKRVKRGYRVFYDPDHVPSADSPFTWWVPADDAEYHGIKSLKEIKGQKLTSIKRQIKQIELKIARDEEELRELRKRKPESFAESLNRSNQFASIDLEKHGELQALGLKWLHSQGYVATAELTLPGNLRVDVIGYNEKGEICILECKAHLHDFYRDEKWERYLAYCDRFYFVMPKDLAYYDQRMKAAGLLKANKKNLEVMQECQELEPAKQSQETIFVIGRQLSRRYAFGY